MPRTPSKNSQKTTLLLSKEGKRCLVALSQATGDDMGRVVEDAITHYSRLLIEQNPELLRIYPDLKLKRPGIRLRGD
jgi:hypothetical protein